MYALYIRILCKWRLPYKNKMHTKSSTQVRKSAVGLKGAVHITSLNPKFNGSHFGLPPSSIHRMAGWVAISRIHRCVLTGDRPGYETRRRLWAKEIEKDQKLTGVWRGSAFALDLGCFLLLLSLEIFTSRSSELCFSETVGSSVGSAPESVDRDRHRVVKLLSHSDHSVRR